MYEVFYVSLNTISLVKRQLKNWENVSVVTHITDKLSVIHKKLPKTETADKK